MNYLIISILSFPVSTFYLTSLIGVDVPSEFPTNSDLFNCTIAPLITGNSTTVFDENCAFEPPETALITKIIYALWVWAIFLTFPGTFAMQPAVTTQTFGHK